MLRTIMNPAMRKREIEAASGTRGFTLIEMMIALLVLTFGLLAAGQLILLAAGSASLARSKAGAAQVAQGKLEFLADIYRQDISAAEVAVGNHGPEQVQVSNPSSGTVLNRFSVAWTVMVAPDPRPGKVLNARTVTVTVSPVDAAGSANNKVLLNKIVSVSTVFSPRI